MPVNVIGTLKPKNNGKFPVAEAVDIKVTEDLRLDEALENKADLETVNYALANKADKTTTTALQAQIDNIVSGSTEDSEVINARVGADGTSYNTLKARLDAEEAQNQSVETALRKDISDIDNSIIPMTGNNLFNVDDIDEGYYLNYQTGQKTTNASYGESNYIKVKSQTTYYINNFGGGCQVCYYDKYKSFISGSLISSGSGNFTTPSDTCYIRISLELVVTNSQITEGEAMPYEAYAFYGYKFEGSKTADAEVDNAKKSISGAVYSTLKSRLDEEYSELGKSISDVTYIKYSTNLFDKTVYIDGEFLGTDGVETANADYFISDYIYLYDSSLDKLTWYTYNGAAVRFVAFYDTDKVYINNSWKQIGGTEQANTFDIPSNAVYVRISTQKTQLNTTQLEYGTSYSGYVPYTELYHKLKIGNSIIVDKSGLGDYTTVTEAVANAKSGDVIYIYKGVYENEVIEAWGKNISLVGFDARNTIIRNATDNYDTPPLEISIGSVINLTFETTSNAETAKKAYAVHVEHDSLTNGNLTFTNCIFKAASNASVGVGLRPNCVVEFNNCTMEVGNGLNAFFFHDSADYSGVQNMICNGCKITAGNAQAIRIDDNNVSGTTMYIEFVNTLVRNMSNLSSSAIWFNNTGHESGSGIGGLTNTYLSDKSYGNSVAALNA